MLRIDTPSDCFQSVTWRATDDDGLDGICTGTIWRGGAVVYDTPMTLDEFEDFASSESLGKWNAENQPFG